MTRIPKKAIFSLCGPFHRGYKTCRLWNKGAWLEPSSFVDWLQNSWILIYLDIRHSRVGSQAESSRQILEGEASEVLSKGGAGSVRRKNVIFSCPGRMFSYCVRARAYTHVLAHVYSTRASTCTIYTCFTLPPTRVNPTGLQLSIFQNFGLLWPILEHLCCQTNFMVGLNRIETTLTLTLTTVEAISEKSWPCLICLQFIYLQTDHVMPPSLDFERE